MRRPTSSLVPAVVLAVGVLACGHKGPPIAPELVRPEAPEQFTAMATPDGVKLGWLRPLRYSGGQRMDDLRGFVIERATGTAGFVKIGRLELEDQNRFRKERHLEWTDPDVKAGERYLYRVTAETLDGYRSAPVGPIAVQYGPPAETPP
jgi:hypothetical protein